MSPGALQFTKAFRPGPGNVPRAEYVYALFTAPWHGQSADTAAGV
jgi:hypothetical protein